MALPPLELGWFTLCIRTGSFAATRAFYEALGFRLTGGQPEQGWAAMASGTTELTLMSFLQANLINLRGGNVIDLAEALSDRGCDPFHSPGFDPTSTERQAGPRRFDPDQWPSEFSLDRQGRPITQPGAGDFLIADPDGKLLYFDSVPLERVRFEAGERFAGEHVDGSVAADQPDLGRLVLRLSVSDLEASREFYERLGLEERRRDRKSRYIELGNALDVPFVIGLCSEPDETDAMTFECDDLDRLVTRLEERGLQVGREPARPIARLEDPEGNPILFVQRA
ncbi:MAG: hypothetical protein B7733_21360 [Myxococcales bacterium FL481]|nr:MAG: hypothetical protein B7733_21360 [Myxococcales bacterium FL481]